MIVQAIGLLDDLDKELNTYAMRVREWYGWHFPEMSRIVTDNVLYAKTVSMVCSLEAVCTVMSSFALRQGPLLLIHSIWCTVYGSSEQQYQTYISIARTW